MVALVGALGRFHLPQQRIHLGHAQAAVRVDGGPAGERAQKPVRGAVEMMPVGSMLQIAHDLATISAMFSPDSSAGTRAQRQPCGAQRVELEAGALPLARVLEHCLELVGLELDDDRLEQLLRRRRAAPRGPP